MEELEFRVELLSDFHLWGGFLTVVRSVTGGEADG